MRILGAMRQPERAIARALAACFAVAAALPACFALLDFDGLAGNTLPDAAMVEPRIDAEIPIDSGTTADAGGCVADLETDGQHCGRCFHSCLGGACARGACLPVKIAEKQESPAEIFVHEGMIVWANRGWPLGTGTIAQCPVGVVCGDNPQLLATGLQGPGHLQPDGNGVLFLEQGLVRRLDRQTRAVTSVHQGPEAAYLTVSGPLLYYSAYTSDGIYVGPSSALFDAGTLLVAETQPADLLAGAARLFWESKSAPIRACSLPGCTNKVSFPDAGKFATSWVNDFALDETYLYAATQYPDAILRMRHDLTDIQELAPATDPSALALDATAVFWTDRGTGQVFRCPKTGGTPTAVATVQGRSIFFDIAVDDRAIYWTDFASSANLAAGVVWALAK